jgi:protein-arginine kinase activator protein McsA
MEVHYCDLCAGPMKDGQSWILYTASPQAMQESLESKEQVLNYVSKVESEQREICPTCKHLFDRIFFHRLEGMAALTEECVELFNLPPYEKKIVLTSEPKKKKGKK